MVWLFLSIYFLQGLLLEELASNAFDQDSDRSKTMDYKMIRKGLLNTNIKGIGSSVIPKDVNRMDRKRLEPRPMVLQLVESIDIMQPIRLQDLHGNPTRRMLRLKLTDGETTCVCVEYEYLNNIKNKDLVPGVKVKLMSPLVRFGVVLLQPKTVEILGGRVSELADAWEVQQLYGGTKNRSGVKDGGEAENPPLFEHYVASRGKRKQVNNRKPKATELKKDALSGRKPSGTYEKTRSQGSNVNSIAPTDDTTSMKTIKHDTSKVLDGKVTKEVSPPLSHVRTMEKDSSNKNNNDFHAAAREKLKAKMEQSQGNQARGKHVRRGRRRGHDRNLNDETNTLTLEEWEQKQAQKAAQGVTQRVDQSLNVSFPPLPPGNETEDEKLARKLHHELNFSCGNNNNDANLRNEGSFEDDIKSSIIGIFSYSGADPASMHERHFQSRGKRGGRRGGKRGRGRRGRS